MSTVVVFGATGRTGSLIVDLALTRGHHVTATARNPDALADMAARWSTTGRLSIATVDVHDPATVTAAVEGADTAISAIANTGRHPEHVFSDGTANIVKSLQDQHVRRFLCISSRGVNFHDPGLPLIYRAVIRPLFLREVYTDMQRMEAVVAASDLAWTLIRAPRLTNTRARGHYRVVEGRNPPHGWVLSRADLAAFTLDQMNTSTWLHRTPTLAY